MPLAPGTGGHLFVVDGPDNNTARHVKRQVPRFFFRLHIPSHKSQRPFFSSRPTAPTHTCNISLTVRSSRFAARHSRFAIRDLAESKLAVSPLESRSECEIDGNILARMSRVHRNAETISRSIAPVRQMVATETRLASPSAPLVLMADGDAVSRDVREAQLRTAGLRVAVARTGFEAIVKATYHTPDLILLSNSLTGIDAAETLRMLAVCPTTAHIPVVRLLRGKRLSQRILSRLRRVAA